MRNVWKSLLAACLACWGMAADRPAEAQLAFNVSVPIAQPVYYVDPYYPAAYQTYFGFYYPTYNWIPSTYYASYYGGAVTPIVSASTYYSPAVGYPYSFGYPYSYGYAYPYGYGWNTYGYPYAYALTYGAGWPYTTYYGYGAPAAYFTGYYPTAYYGNYYPAAYWATGHYGVW